MGAETLNQGAVLQGFAHSAMLGSQKRRNTARRLAQVPGNVKTPQHKFQIQVPLRKCQVKVKEPHHKFQAWVPHCTTAKRMSRCRIAGPRLRCFCICSHAPSNEEFVGISHKSGSGWSSSAAASNHVQKASQNLFFMGAALRASVTKPMVEASGGVPRLSCIGLFCLVSKPLMGGLSGAHK